MSAAPRPLPRRARAADAAGVAALLARCLPHPWSPAMVEATLRQRGCIGLVQASGLREDVADFDAVALLQVASGEVEVLQLAVDPAARRRGLGRALLRAGLAEARRAGARHAFLEVRPTNAIARALYESEGFSHVGRRPRYYPDGEDADVLARDLA